MLPGLSVLVPPLGMHNWIITGKQATRLHPTKNQIHNYFACLLCHGKAVRCHPEQETLFLHLSQSIQVLIPYNPVSQLLNCSQDGCRTASYKPYALMDHTIYTRIIYRNTLKLPCILALFILKLLLHINDTKIYVAIMRIQKTYFTVLLLCAMHFSIPCSHLKITKYEKCFQISVLFYCRECIRTEKFKCFEVFLVEVAEPQLVNGINGSSIALKCNVRFFEALGKTSSRQG